MPKAVLQETLWCCGYKKCPTITLFEDGSIELSDDDVQTGSTGTVRLRPEQADRLAELLKGRPPCAESSRT
jgi:hypothetical protein